MRLGQRFLRNRAGKRKLSLQACIIATCKEWIEPNSYVRFVNDKLTEVQVTSQGTCHGIVDPFLTRGVSPNQAFIVLLKQNLVDNYGFSVVDFSTHRDPDGDTDDHHDPNYDP